MVKFRYFICKKLASNNDPNDETISNHANTWYLVFLNLIKTNKQSNPITCNNFGI